MKHYSLFLLLFSFLACQTSKSIVTVSPNDKRSITFGEATLVNLNNQEPRGLQVAVVSGNSDQQVRGFGLGPNAQAEVIVEKGNTLILDNQDDACARLKMSHKETVLTESKSKSDYKSLTLRNTSANSIPLIIPGVMNPNLSPFSNSGVSLKIGQEILFKKKARRYVLIQIDDTYNDGQIIDIAQVLKDRKKDLGL